MEAMDSVAVMDVAPVPDPLFVGATPLIPAPPESELVLRRSARCLGRPRVPVFADPEEPKQSTGRRGRPKKKRDEENQDPAPQVAAKVPRKTAKVEPKERKPMPVVAPESVPSADFTAAAVEDDALGTGKSAKLRVKETLRAFNSHYLHLVQEEQKRAQAVIQEIQAKGAAKNKDGKKGGEGETKEKRPSKRPDLKAITKMQENNSVLYTEKVLGPIPGIDVGDQFYSRAEMVVLGIHSHWLNGIDYMGMKYQEKKEYQNFTFPMATCIVMSGIYEDDLDKADEIIYTGQGGNDLLGNHRQIGSQQLNRGNLALKNSKDNGNLIRVIRGHVAKNSYTGKIYTYDGLYKVVDDWVQKGVQGHVVYKYKLKRLEGQPSLTTTEVRFTRAEAPRKISELPGLVCDDISGGQENIPIPATNVVDDPPVPPSARGGQGRLVHTLAQESTTEPHQPVFRFYIHGTWQWIHPFRGIFGPWRIVCNELIRLGQIYLKQASSHVMNTSHLKLSEMESPILSDSSKGGSGDDCIRPKLTHGQAQAPHIRRTQRIPNQR